MNASTTELIWIEPYGAKLRLYSPTFTMSEDSADSSLDTWISDNVTWHKTPKIVKATIISSTSTFVVDGSFFLDKSHLVSTHWRCIKDEILLAKANFALTVEIQHRNACTAKLCGYLVVIQFVE